MMYQIC